MPRGSTGTYSLPIAAFAPGGLIKASDHNSNYSDLATAMTQSLATTGVSTMTGPIISAVGSLSAPSVTFNGALKTGFLLSGTNQIAWSSNGVQGATFNSDTSVTWAGGATFGGTVSANKGTIPIGAVADFAGSTAPAGWLLCFGQLVSTTTYAALFAILSTTYGSGAGTFGIPDYRGRTAYGQDNMGGSAANRITVAGGNFDGTVLGGTGGGQNHTMTAGELVSHNHGVNDPTHAHTSNANIKNAATGIQAASGITTIPTDGAATINAASTGISIQNNGSGNPFTIMNPAIITQKIIYAGV